MQAAVDDFGTELEIINTNRDRQGMISAAAELATRTNKPDDVIVANEIKQGRRAYKTLSEASIKIFILLNPLQDSETIGLDTNNLVGRISPDNEIAGYAQATRPAGKDSDGVQIMALLGDLVTPAAIKRTEGMERAVAEHADAAIVRAMSVNWSADKAKDRTQRFLKAGQTASTDMFFAGLNWSRPAMDAVSDGRMTMTHGGHFFAGAWSIALLNDFHTGQTAIDDQGFPMPPIHAENVDNFLERLGEGDWQRIDFQQFASENQEYDFSSDAILSASP
ncbi:substrate-binding domain-containing protein [Shimia sp.]|uniref:substrate-binding domain-containing protein n=1 Tax=Shimia sp. TaxID=1954381 RepID=UPI003B8E2C13